MFDLKRAHWADRRLRPLQKLVLAVLAVDADHNGHSRTTFDSLVRDTGAKRDAVVRAVGRLVRLGWLVRVIDGSFLIEIPGDMA